MKDKWDEVYRNTPLEKIPWYSEKPERILIELVEKGEIKKGKVMDLCSGDGTNSIYLASLGYDVSGVEISETAIKIAKNICKQKGLSCNYKTGNVLSFKIKEKYDLVFDRGCFHHIPDNEKNKYVKRVAKMLNDKGKFLLYCFSDKNVGWEKAFSKEEIKNYFSEYFKIMFIDDVIRTEPSGRIIYLYCVFMQRL